MSTKGVCHESSTTTKEEENTSSPVPHESFWAAAEMIFEMIASKVDLLTEILIRLPAKPLLRFKTVSISWLSIISGSHVSMLWKPKPDSGLFVTTATDESSIKYRHKHDFIPLINGLKHKALMRSLLLDQDRSIQILHSCKGLFLTRSTREHAIYYFICSPVTKKFITIRRCPKKDLKKFDEIYTYLVADIISDDTVRYYKVFTVKNSKYIMSNLQ